MVLDGLLTRATVSDSAPGSGPDHLLFQGEHQDLGTPTLPSPKFTENLPLGFSDPAGSAFSGPNLPERLKSGGPPSGIAFSGCPSPSRGFTWQMKAGR